MVCAIPFIRSKGACVRLRTAFRSALVSAFVAVTATAGLVPIASSTNPFSDGPKFQPIPTYREGPPGPFQYGFGDPLEARSDGQKWYIFKSMKLYTTPVGNWQMKISQREDQIVIDQPPHCYKGSRNYDPMRNPQLRTRITPAELAAKKYLPLKLNHTSCSG
jgi:hypothetical protein